MRYQYGVYFDGETCGCSRAQTGPLGVDEQLCTLATAHNAALVDDSCAQRDEHPSIDSIDCHGERLHSRIYNPGNVRCQP